MAIKKVLQDKRFKNRELQIMKMMDHCNVVQLKHCFYTTTEKDEVFLNLVLEFVPETVYRIGKHYSKNGQRMPTLFVKLYVYQVKHLRISAIAICQACCSEQAICSIDRSCALHLVAHCSDRWLACRAWLILSLTLNGGHGSLDLPM